VLYCEIANKFPKKMPRNYIEFNALNGYPAGESIFYECLICETILPSLPSHAVACKCRNVIVDTDAGRIAVKSSENMRIFFENKN